MPGACIAYSGSAAWGALPAALAALRPRFGRLPVHAVSEPGEAERLAAGLAGSRDPLVVLGGDGTIHELANGLPLDREPDGPAIGLLPGAWRVLVPEPCALGQPARRGRLVRGA